MKVGVSVSKEPWKIMRAKKATQREKNVNVHKIFK